MSMAPTFEKAKVDGRGVLIGCMPAGFPTVPGGIAAMKAMVQSGVDIVEVEFPYSDPVMDGPVIQRASEIALAGGVRTTDVLHTVEAAAQAGAPVALMTYWNPIERYGVDRFARDLASAGGAGLITPDLIPDEAAEWLAAAQAHGLDHVFLAAPASTDERLRNTVRHSKGFVYAASIMGVTGTREQVSNSAPGLVARLRQVTDLPIGVGLGVRDGAQVAAVAGYADGVVVGSALIRCLLEAPDEVSGLAALRELTAELAAGVRAPARD
jgi:tryptophan synthase alpha chain